MHTIQQVCHVIPPPRKIIQQCLSWAPYQQKLKIQKNGGHQKFLESNENNSRESLVVGEFSDGRWAPQVPKGFLVVYVGSEMKRFVIPMSYLSMPEFRVLMDEVEEEFGFEQEGALQFPCDEQDFEEILVKMRKMMSKKKKNRNKKN
ncbi:hypothetical protein HS088_TW10G00626 [Tripterygium wilfordii]|uniref:Uncharacterized protein n=1 Tax=Tripterygium wilfordii TaxID=458696 RepID=A0A7J7D5M5_TRIWF|nr:hypothetical protein HS088_TW10G00626 [Tripterygium wilfordii]